MYDKRIEWLYKLIDTLFSFVRIVCSTSFRKTLKIRKGHNQCIIMGNGPSLLKTLKENEDKLDRYDLLAVNFMALTPEYLYYKPHVYVICDSAFWYKAGDEDCQNRVRLMYRMMVEKTDWPLELYIPYEAKCIKRQFVENSNIHIHFYNKTKFDGYNWLRYKVFNLQWGMVRTQNVLNAALMLTIYSEYEQIFLMGAETNNLKDIWVDEQNQVRLYDTHYYAKADANHDLVLSVHMPEQCAAFYHTFKSYWDIERYAENRKVKIFNLTPGSFIDAFEKR